jgi:hypothetical protein
MADFIELFGRVTIEGHQLTNENFRPGTSGQTALREMLRTQTGL